MNREKFKTIYRQALRECVDKYPQQYAWHYVGDLDSEVDRVAGRMFDAMDRGTFGHDSKAFKLTAKRLGIKPTRKAIIEFWTS
jgi:hypothetical protein